MPERADDITLNVARLAALFYSLTSALYVAVQAEPSPIMVTFLASLPAWAVILWLQKDAQRTGVAVLDWGYFLLLAWPVVIPWYALKTRRAAGWKLIAELFGLIAAPYISGIGVALAMWFLGARAN